MTYAFIVFYHLKPMTEEESLKAREFWIEFSQTDWPSELAIIGDYSYAWGSEWNGFLLIESENPEMFFDFWPKFRDKTRWYIDNTRTIIARKQDPSKWMG